MSDLTITIPEQLAEIPDNYIAALDIGSNSIHFVYGRVIDDHLQILHTEKYSIALAAGLNKHNMLTNEAIERALATLTLLALTVQKLSKENFRVVATYTLRQAKNAAELLKRAAEVFPFDIEIISGHEEARLIYQGVAHYYQPNGQRLVIDIGGGSSECVIGENFTTKELASLSMGCISFSEKYFSQGRLTESAFNKAIINAKLTAESIVKRFKRRGWQHVIGTSGTVKTIVSLINQEQNKSTNTPITLVQLHMLKRQLVDFGHIDNITFVNLKENRRKILAGGLSILIALSELLSIESLDFCEYSLREGVLFEKFAGKCDDIQQRTIDSLSTRFAADQYQVSDVCELSEQLFKQVADAWQLNAIIYQKLLKWASQLHEIGLSINPSSYHKHGQYIIASADLAGFNQEQHQILAWLVGNQRKKVELFTNHASTSIDKSKIKKLLVLLRLAILLSQQRQLTTLPSLSISAEQNNLYLMLAPTWLEQRPLIAADLIQEQAHIKKLGIKLKLS